MMYDLILKFPNQLEEALQIGKNTQLVTKNFKPANILVSGLGGSGIGADITYLLIGNELQIPYVISKGYDIPAFTGSGTLFLASSYSGNTEEVLATVDVVLNSGATMVCITSGGMLKEVAKSGKFHLVELPEGIFAPRACLGYSLVLQLFILHKFKIISDSFIGKLENATRFLREQQSNIMKDAESLAPRLKDKIIFIYADGMMAPLALRLKQQINENAKQMCVMNVFPEMNHNEIVGWDFPETNKKNTVVILLRSDFNHKRVKVRMNILKPVLQSKTADLIEIHSKGSSFYEHVLYLEHFSDWLSYYLALVNNTDPDPIDVIDYLKKQLTQS